MIFFIQVDLKAHEVFDSERSDEAFFTHLMFFDVVQLVFRVNNRGHSQAAFTIRTLEYCYHYCE